MAMGVGRGDNQSRWQLRMWADVGPVSADRCKPPVQHSQLAFKWPVTDASWEVQTLYGVQMQQAFSGFIWLSFCLWLS